mmetsp:Transcript_3268/g.9253  ORF Transcript_3268/g.9253 Transcript_3268/m.9253 type:complete len:226 (+) Transcript_3268:460-1137(+)
MAQGERDGANGDERQGSRGEEAERHDWAAAVALVRGAAGRVRAEQLRPHLHLGVACAQLAPEPSHRPQPPKGGDGGGGSRVLGCSVACAGAVRWRRPERIQDRSLQGDVFRGHHLRRLPSASKRLVQTDAPCPQQHFTRLGAFLHVPQRPGEAVDVPTAFGDERVRRQEAQGAVRRAPTRAVEEVHEAAEEACMSNKVRVDGLQNDDGEQGQPCAGEEHDARDDR